MLTSIHSLFLNDLLTLLGAVWSEPTSLARVAVARVAALLVEWLGTALCALLPNDEVRRAVQVSISLPSLQLLVLAVLVRVFTDVAQDLTALNVLHGPSGYVIIGLLFLEALENDLVLTGDLHKLTLACISIETLFEAWELPSGSAHLLRDRHRWTRT